MIFQIIFALFGVALIPIVIVNFLPKETNFFEKSAVKGFGLGVYLMLVGVLMMEAFEEGGVTSGITWFVVGLVLSFVIGFIFKEFHHHHDHEEESRAHNNASMWRILLSDFFHNIVDGIAIIAGFAISPAVGAVSFLGVLGHQIVQQVGQHILLVDNGMGRKKAIFVSLIIALSIFLGFAIDESALEIILLAAAGGIVAWKVWVDLMHTKWDKQAITGFVAGALVLAIILLSIPHAH